MSQEHLSEATAERQADRMMHDLHSTARAARPPRMDPPTSGRPNMEASSARVVEGDVEVVPVVEVVAPLAKAEKPASRKPLTPAQRMMSEFRAAEPDLHIHISPVDRERLRRALCSPSRPWEQMLYVHPELTVLAVGILVSLACYVAVHQSARGYRSATSPSPPPVTTRRVVESLIASLTGPR